VAVNRDVYFEIKYVPAIKDLDERKDTIARSHQYHMWGRSKNVVITSEARHKFDLRSPYDIANLGLIFGLSEEHAKSAILSMGRKLLLRAGKSLLRAPRTNHVKLFAQFPESRRLGKTVMIVRKVQDFGDYDDTESDDEESDEAMEEQPFKKAKIGK
jgi:ribonuclease P/MRP protein subunit RPP1